MSPLLTAHVDRKLLHEHYNLKRYTMNFQTYLENVSEELKKLVSYANGELYKETPGEGCVYISQAESVQLSKKYISDEIIHSFCAQYPGELF